MKGGGRGQSAVEFALTAPLLILGLFGLIQVAYLVYGINTVSNAAREGARAAISAQSACLYNDPLVVAAVNRATAGVNGITITTNTGTGLVGLSYPEVHQASVSTSLAAGVNHASGAYCEVTVTWAFKPLSGALPLPSTNISSTSRLYYNGDSARWAPSQVPVQRA